MQFAADSRSSSHGTTGSQGRKLPCSHCVRPHFYRLVRLPLLKLQAASHAVHPLHDQQKPPQLRAILKLRLMDASWGTPESSGSVVLEVVWGAKWTKMRATLESLMLRGLHVCCVKLEMPSSQGSNVQPLGVKMTNAASSRSI